jgi:hypothetical protein
MMETGLVFLIVVGAAAYVGRIFYRGFKQKNACGCGCTCCTISDSCSEPAGPKAGEAPPVPTDR